jgi:hypothetical protein
MNTAVHRYTPMAVRELSELANELQRLAEYKLTSNGNGEYTGSILGFVKGLRLSAKLIYFLRKALSGYACEVNWGHVIDVSTGACSPECDVIIHKRGHLEHWNGGREPVMDFKFIEARNVIAVVSCKSRITSIDEEYAKLLSLYGIQQVILFAECCSKSNYENLNEKAIEAGYTGLWCAYFKDPGGDDFQADEIHHQTFYNSVVKLCGTALGA